MAFPFPLSCMALSIIFFDRSPLVRLHDVSCLFRKWAHLGRQLPFSTTIRNVGLMRTESLSVLCWKRIHYCNKSILSQFPSGLLRPENSLRFLLTCVGSRQRSHRPPLAGGRNGWLSDSVLRPNGPLFNIVLSSSSLSNHRLKKYNLHYIHSVLRCRTNQCSYLTV